MIFVESPMANDSISWEYLKNGWSKNYQKFYHVSDSLQKSFHFNTSKFNKILQKPFSKMTDKDLEYLITSFAYKRDNGNYGFYSYIKKHGIKGAKKSTRHEDGDLTYKLALFSGQKLLVNMDDQRTNKEYHTAWRKCVKEGITNGNNVINQKINKKNYKAAIFPGLFRRLGKQTNKRKSLLQLHQLSSFTYVKVKTAGCTDGEKYWNERNSRMAKNIVLQVLKANKKRNIVIVGASHVIGLEQELKEKYTNIKVILMND